MYDDLGQNVSAVRLASVVPDIERKVGHNRVVCTSGAQRPVSARTHSAFPPGENIPVCKVVFLGVLGKGGRTAET